ncbi:class A beta-lactamase [Legionella israelensis]|uniref:beta-lactamase n=2 Tax=Legionella israelensis TaxID=454 RepID=A0AAX1ECX7_9GAMM|nr:class A beta-lactamase [Legionella israelensis]
MSFKRVLMIKSIRLFLYMVSLLFLFAGHCNTYAATPRNDSLFALKKKLAELESQSGGRIGLYAINTADNSYIQYRANERFPTGCTSKVMGVAAVLQKSMSEPLLLQKKLFYKQEELTNWNPVTEKHLRDGMTVEALCAAAISYSDNTAMNLLVKQLGGVQVMNIFARSIGDTVFRQDHGWSQEAMSGGLDNVNDSSTPKAMAKSLQRLALGHILAESQRQLLISWLQQNTTGEARIRAGVPKGWIVGDKTGTGMYYGTTNDIAIIWPPKSAPIVLVVYFTNDHQKTAEKQESVIAQATKLVINAFAAAYAA